MKDNMEIKVRSYIAENSWLQKLTSVTYNPLHGDKSNLGDDSLKTIGQYSIPFPEGLSEAVQQITGDSEAKKFLVFMTALHILVYKYTGANDILTATTGFLDDEAGKNPGGLLFFRVEVKGECIIRDLLNNALGDLNTAYENRHFDYELFFKRFCQQNPGEEKALTALALVYDRFNTESRLTGDCDLLFCVQRVGGGFDLVITYAAPYYNHEKVEQVGRHFINVLTSTTENPGKTVDQVNVLSGEDLKKLLEDFCGETVEYQPGEQTFLSSFAAQVSKTPWATAVTCENRKLNYRELDQISNRLARLMHTRGLLQSEDSEDLAVILMERSEKMMISIIAAWKCGAAYVPIDPDYPGERIKTIIDDSRAKLLVTMKGILRSDLENTLKSRITVINLEEMDPLPVKQSDSSNDSINPQLRPTNPAYVIYTSGSTGNPKGVVVEHRGMMNHLYAKIAEIQIDAQSIIAQNASQCFDISVWQFFAALLAGGCTTVYSQQVVLSPEMFIKRSGTDGVTIMEVVPAYLDMMLNIIEDRKLEHVFPSLKYLLVTGETVRPSLVKRWFEKFPGIKMVNAYGPTEASDDITHFIMDRYPGGKSIPIGRTLRNTGIYIVDAGMNLCPIGIKGELYVSGAGVCRGYLNNPELTAANFINHLLIKSFLGSRGDFSKKPLVAAGTLYRTGDLACWLPDGNIEFFGRKDFQVKIRGFRIELEEIENKLSTIPGIRSAVVLDKEDKTGNKYLCAYIILKEGASKKQEEIKQELRKVLPEYMIPANILILEGLPLAPNGKVDRRALRATNEAGMQDTEYTPPAPPRSEAEKKLTEIWQEVLAIEKIGIHDNFFNLGGDSFKAIQVVNKIQEWLEEVVHVTVLFMARTIAELAVKLESYQKPDLETRMDASKFAEFRALIRPPVPLPSSYIPAAKTPPVMFILCPFRSGSTLLRVILAGHPGLFAPQEFELLSFNTLAERKEALSGTFGLYLEGVIRAIMELRQIGADEAKAMMEEFEASGMTVPEFYGKLQSWLGKRMLVEKTPEYAYHTEILKRAETYFTSPLYIHLIRNPYAVIHSYEEARLDQLFKYQHRFSPRQLGELLWVTCHQNILQFLENIPANRQFQLKYEDLVSEPASWAEKMCRHFRLEFYPGMLDVYKDAGNRMTDGIYNQSKMLGDIKFFTHQSIDTQSVNLWKEKYKTDFLSAEACKLAAEFGYLEAKIAYSRIEAVPCKENYALSPAQKRMWLLNHLEENNIAYNILQVLRVEGNLDVSALEKAFESVVKRHEGLRTTFITVDGEPRQKIHDFDAGEFKLEYLDMSRDHPGDGEEQAKNLVHSEADTPFDLEKGPLFRIILIRLEVERYIFIFNMHHIISDGWSMRILTDELLKLYEVNSRGETGKTGLPELRYQYKDYSEWINHETMEMALKRQAKYWLKEYEGEIPVLELPTDYPRPPVQDFAGSRIDFEIDHETSGSLKTLTLEAGATLYIVLLAIYNILLAKLCRQEDIVIGSPAAGRRHADLEKIIGVFVNTLALRNYPSGEKKITDFLTEVKDRTLNAFDNQDYQYENLVEKVVLTRDLSRNPLFDTMFTLQNTGPQKIDVPGLKLLPYEYENKTSKFDLTLIAVEIEEKLNLAFEYSTKLFRRETVERLIIYFKNILRNVVENKNRSIFQLEILSAEEKKRILFEYNDTEADYPKEKPIHQLFEEQVKRTPDHIALVGANRHLRNRHLCVPINLSYRHLNEQSNRLGELLIKKCVQADTIVAILMQRSAAMVIEILGILKAGGAYLPIDPNYPQERIDYLLKDSGARILINKSEIRNPKLETNPNVQIINAQNKNQNFGAVFVLNLENLNFDSVSCFDIRTSNLSSSNLAYVIYTSGSTGRPKGVLVEHRSVVNLIYHMYNHYEKEVGIHDRCLGVTNFMFDVSVWEFFLPLAFGAKLVLLQDQEIFDVFALAKAILAGGITLIYLPPALLKPVHEQLKIQSGRLKLDKMLVGVEPIRDEILEDYMRLNPGMKIINGYGPTETTICATSYNYFSHDPLGDIVPIGVPLANTQVILLDTFGCIVPQGIPGEICISGDGVSRGYLNNPELTAEKFVFRHSSFVIRSHSNFSNDHFYKTGDIARFLPDGNLLFIGRRDNQLKIRGYRIELGEIENRLLKHPEVQEALVLSTEDKDRGGNKSLAAYYVSDSDLPAAELREHLLSGLPDYMIPSYFVHLEKIPLTPNGKVDRRALPRPEFKTGKNYVAPKTGVEKKISHTWKEVLRLDDIGIFDNFFELGGNSLQIITINNKLKQILKMNIPVAIMFTYPTIESLANYLSQQERINSRADKKNSAYLSIEPAEKKEFYQLSSAQKRLYILHRFDLNSTAYNLPRIFSLEGKINITLLTESFKKLISRHESLRTSFETINEEPVQKIQDNLEFEIQNFNISLDETGYNDEIEPPGIVYNQLFEDLMIETFISPFTLASAPLFRVGLRKTGKDKHILMIDMHHIITDGVSENILIRDFMSLYAGRELPSLKLQYTDYSEWQQSQVAQNTLAKQEEYWLKEFAENIPVLNMPLDYSRPTPQSFEGDIVHFELDDEEIKRLNEMAYMRGGTLFMVILAIYNIFLAKLSGQENIVVGIPIAGRRHPDLEKIVGVFINTLAVRNSSSPGKTFKLFLEELREKTIEALENQDYQLEYLVEKIGVPRDRSRNPLFDVMFSMQNYFDTDSIDSTGRIDSTGGSTGTGTGDLKITSCHYKNNSSKVDLNLIADVLDEKLHFSFEYCTKLFTKETILKFIQYFKKITASAIMFPARKISEIEIMSEEEKNHILYDFNSTESGYPGDKTFHESFEEQVYRNPDHIIAVGPSSGFIHEQPVQISYRELNNRSNHIAKMLSKKGIHREVIIAIMVKTSLKMVIGIIGIIKSGCTFLPIEPESPIGRINFILNDSDAGILLTQGYKKETFNAKTELVNIEDTNLYVGECRNSINKTESAGPLYANYTIGAGGNPKGVLINNRNLTNYIHWFIQTVCLKADDKALLTFSYDFDALYSQLFSSLVTGCRLHVIPQEIALSAEELLSYLRKHKITYIKMTPPLFNLVINSPVFSADLLQELRLIILVSEEIKSKDVEKALILFPNLHLMIHYGPTETTIGSIARFINTDRLEPYKTAPGIGKPIYNTRFYILDMWFNIVPIGVVGRLFIGGDGVGMGYLNNPELTSGKFITDLLGKKINAYCTNDLVRWLADGNIQFFGRIDQQVTIKGYRVELAEIRNRLVHHPHIEDAVALVRESESGEKIICAYIVVPGTASSAAPEDTLNASQLRNYLSGNLPDYMLPSHFVKIGKIPLTANGQIDMNALEKMGEMQDGGTVYAPPTTELEMKIAGIWAELLNLDKVSINDDFFELGGNSLTTLALASRIREIGCPLSLGEVLSNLTIKKMASIIEQKNISNQPDEKFFEVPLPNQLDCIEKLNNARNEKNIFIIHPMDGMVNLYKELAVFLGEKYNVYGIIDEA